MCTCRIMYICIYRYTHICVEHSKAVWSRVCLFVCQSVCASSYKLLFFCHSRMHWRMLLCIHVRSKPTTRREALLP